MNPMSTRPTMAIMRQHWVGEEVNDQSFGLSLTLLPMPPVTLKEVIPPTLPCHHTRTAALRVHRSLKDPRQGCTEEDRTLWRHRLEKIMTRR